MPSTSWCTETGEKVNYTKLCRLLVDGGTQAVRSVFDGIHSPSSLKAALNANKTTLQRLRRPRRRVLNNEQWDKLYPPSGSSPKSEDFDITLLFALLRNICGLTAPATGWDALPPVTDKSLEANLAKIKYYRNNTIAHKPNTEINDVDFEQHWQDISSALLSLGGSQDDIDDLKSAPLGKKDYNQLLYDWYMSDQDIKIQLEEVKSDTADIKSDAADIKSGAADIKSDTADIKSDIAHIKEKVDDIQAHKMDQSIQKLAFSDFRAEISTKCKSFHPNTRQWILDQVKSHVESDQPDSCLMLITAGPGMGKSTIAAKICQTYQDLGCLAGCHFFQFSDSTRNNPRLMLQSIARQMCYTVPGYREALERKLQTDLGKEITEMKCEELLTILLEEPFCNLKQPDSNLVVVIDALDECSHDPRDELLKALRKKRPCFPSWLRFILTSRPSKHSLVLGSIVSVEIRPEDQPNFKDLELFFSHELGALYPQYVYNDDNPQLVKSLVQTTQGLFLVAFLLMDDLKRASVASPEKAVKLLPRGISSVYENYFSRLKEVLLPYISEEERFYKMLEAILATEDPLPIKMFYSILCLKSEREVLRQEKKKRKDALNALHWLFPVEGDHVTAFHKSVIDWLTLRDDKEHDFSVRVEDGNEVLTSQCNDALSDIRNGKKDLDTPLNLTDSEKYALRFLRHLVEEHPLDVKQADKYGFFSDIYLLTALKIHHIGFGMGIGVGIIPRPLLALLDVIRRFPIHSPHMPYCHFFRPTSFGRYLAFVCQRAHALGMIEETTPTPLDILKKYSFPYFDEESLLQAPLLTQTLFSLQYLFKCKEGVVAVIPISGSNSLSTEICVFHPTEGSMRRKCFPCTKLITTSPNINFIVVTEEKGKKIEVLDVATLEVVSQYDIPHDDMETCHAFGDVHSCFIVIKRYNDNTVYVIEGLTGQAHKTIILPEGSTVMEVSPRGHIVITRTWERYPIDPPIPSKTYLYHYDREQEEPIDLYPVINKLCSCLYHVSRNVDETVQFSEDSRLVAYHYLDSIFIVNTSDGSLFKRLLAGNVWTSGVDIVFLSESYLVLIEKSLVLVVINIQTDEIEHRMYLPHPVFPDGKEYLLSSEANKTTCFPYRIFPNRKKYLLFPEKEGKSFSLISNHFLPSQFCELSKLVFQNLNLQGLR